MAETMKHTGSEMSRLDSSEQFAVITVMRGLFRVEVRPRRRWKWWGKRGWLVVLHLLHEQDHTWRCHKFITVTPGTQHEGFFREVGKLTGRLGKPLETSQLVTITQKYSWAWIQVANQEH